MERFVFTDLIRNVEELKALEEMKLNTPYQCVALTMLTLCNYENDEEATIKMLDELKGPADVSNFEKQFLKERLKNKQYKVHSFFEGANVENGYTMNKPYTITIYDNPYSFTQENWATLYVQSSGADHLRSLKLRRKPSTNQWFLVEIQCLSDIRLPKVLDEWA